MDENTESFEETGFRWLYHCGLIKNLHEQCKQYENECLDSKIEEKRIYRFTLIIDVGELIDFDVQLGNIVCNQPKKGQRIFKEACFTCIQTLNWMPGITSKAQLDLQLRYLSIPHFISCSSLFAMKKELLENGKENMPLFSTVGIVCGMTSTVNYTQSTWYECINNTCQSSLTSEYTGGENLSGDRICINCGTPLEEDISCRVLGEKCLVYIISPDGFSHNLNMTNKKCGLLRSILIYLRDELINEVELGALYSFSLIPFREFCGGQYSNQLNLVFEANNITKISAYPLSKPQDTFLHVKSNFRTIQKLYEDCKYSPWSFVASLAYYFGDSVTPPGTYVRLKLGLLLSLVSQQSSNKEAQLSGGHIHILTVSKDVLPIQRLFLYSKSFTERSVVYSSCNDLCYCICKDHSNLASCVIHSGCLLLANNGVCVLRNLNELKNNEVEELENVIQTECVNVDVPKKYIVGQQSQISVPLTCKIWACYEITKKSGTRSHKTYHNLQEYGQLSKTLLDCFSFVLIMTENEEASSEIFSENLIVQEILRKSYVRRNQEKSCIPENEFLQFLEHASRAQPSFSNEARELIQGFYLASRRTRFSGLAGVEFPIAALKSMMSLAEAHAKLSLRSEVSEDDAVMAILLYEESITARVGYSVLGVNPVHHFKDDNIASYIGKENDEKMTQFKIHMKRFCSLHSNYKYIPGYVSREE